MVDESQNGVWVQSPLKWVLKIVIAWLDNSYRHGYGLQIKRHEATDPRRFSSTRMVAKPISRRSETPRRFCFDSQETHLVARSWISQPSTRAPSQVPFCPFLGGTNVDYRKKELVPSTRLLTPLYWTFTFFWGTKRGLQKKEAGTRLLTPLKSGGPPPWQCTLSHPRARSHVTTALASQATAEDDVELRAQWEAGGPSRRGGGGGPSETRSREPQGSGKPTAVSRGSEGAIWGSEFSRNLRSGA